ncbi:23S rRNA (adenine(2503)-C(2))-methyltransferase RlmN [Candidatus Peregrinibacteria bacterium]|nr:MAG: 23S rRNA (adenine(2503)-C(2))-methyltransferase RlmN [Candidatus Peregrinibacteria bacterium]
MRNSCIPQNSPSKEKKDTMFTDMYPDTWIIGEKEFRKKQLRRALFREFISAFEEMSVFPKALQEKLIQEIPFSSFEKVKHLQGEETEKILFRLTDGKQAEAVLMKHKGRNTVCVSSQVGCAANCSFCSTGALGFTRHLTDREIVEQVLFFARSLKKKWQEENSEKKWNLETTPPEYRVRNIVFMGMGEPLLNFENVKKALEIFESPEGMNLGVRHITISTVGIAAHIPQLLSLERLPNLAVSLHAATDELRGQIVPMNKGFPLKKLFAALDEYTEKTGRRIFYEWTVLREVNDTKEQMEALGELLQHRSAHVNFIPWNPGPSREKYRKPSMDHIRKMQDFLQKNYNIPSTIRALYGDDIAGACGQLAAQEKESETHSNS